MTQATARQVRRCEFCSGTPIDRDRMVHADCIRQIMNSRGVAHDMAVRCVRHPGSNWRLRSTVTVGMFVDVLMERTRDERYSLWQWLNLPGWDWPPPFMFDWLETFSVELPERFRPVTTTAATFESAN